MQSTGEPAASVGEAIHPSAPGRTAAGTPGTALAFALVGASGIIVNQVLLWILVSIGGVNYLAGAVIATQGSTAWNFSLNEMWVFQARRRGKGVVRRFTAYWAVNNATLLLRGPMLVLFTSRMHIHYLVSNLLTLVALFAIRFLVSDRFIWRYATAEGDVATGGTVRDQTAERTSRSSARAQATRKEFLHSYDVHGFATVASDVELPELVHFRVPSLPARADIEIRVGDVGAGPRLRIQVIDSPGVMLYQEHLGRLGANFRVQIFDKVRVTVTPLLALSPHVVYTNIVEALLRFVLASKDLALLHSATLVLEGHGVMLSAHTDTGKTATILRILREQGGVFLSDDMTIVSPHGEVFSYPKPLTISHHTLGAIDGVLKSRKERMVLRVKSSVHSKKGRGTGLRLARMNLPIMSINSVTQAVIPPPKYHVDSLVPCDVGTSTTVQHLFLIGRGPRLDEPVDPTDALHSLIENTDDAYGFPPFQRLAPEIVLDGESYPTLRRRERSIIRQMLTGLDIQRVIRDDFSWADEIPRYVRERAAVAGAPQPDVAAARVGKQAA